MNSNHDSDLILAVVVGTIVFFILVAFSISYLVTYKRKRREHMVEMSEFKKQFENQLLRSQVEVQEQTFQQIGKELHDNVGQLLSTARMLLGLTERNLEKPPDTLLTANETVADAISQLRSLSRSLDKEWLEQFNFSENLDYEIKRINAANTIQAVYDNQYDIRLKPEEQIILFRIVQEAIQNAMKHAQPQNIYILAASEQNNILITVTDDGEGFDPGLINTGMGLANMKHRIQLLGGAIKWERRETGGTKVIITLPVKPEDE